MQKRSIYEKLVKEIATLEIVVITGPRQVGKTTAVQWLLNQIPSQNKYYFDLENIANRELFETQNYETLLSEFQNRGLSLDQRLYIALDEIQLLENLPSVVKYLYDHYQIKFFLTGSSSYYIKNRFSESMAGRKVVYEMFPLSFQEFLDFRGVRYLLPEEPPWNSDFIQPTYSKLSAYYLEYCKYGGLPRVVLSSDINRKKQLLEEIFSSYINIDVQTLADFKSTSDLRRVIKLLAARVGSKLNVSEIANITGLSRVTVDTYLEFLEQTYLIRTISVYSKSADVTTRLQKKPYFIDTGIATINAELSSGSTFENTVCHQVSQWGKLYYFSNSQGEIDFIVDDGSELRAIEVKETPTKTDDITLARRSQKLGIQHYRVIGKEPAATFNAFLWGGLIR